MSKWHNSILCIHFEHAARNSNFVQSILSMLKTMLETWLLKILPTLITGKVQKFKLREQALKDLNLEGHKMS